MKILYAIQGTGNGHISRARDIIPLLQRKGELDILISGTEADVDLGFPVRYRLKGMSFVFGKSGGIDVISTYKKARLKRFFKEVQSVPVNEYDLVINDFEPVSAWACHHHKKECIGLSHQAAVLNKKSPQPSASDFVGKSILKNYAPVSDQYGFHFRAYDAKIFTPVIRDEIRNADNIILPHYTVYLPAYDDEKIIKVLTRISHIEWDVFSKHAKRRYRKQNISITPINNNAFIKSLVSATGVLCGAGFETPAEALFLKKKLMVVPMKGQFEQQCNAAALKEMGVPVIRKFKKGNVDKIKEWVTGGSIIAVDYPNITHQVIEDLFNQYATAAQRTLMVAAKNADPEKKELKLIRLGHLLHQISG